MSEFSIAESALDGYAQKLSALADDVGEATSYLEQHVSVGLSDSGLLLSYVIPVSNSVESAVRDMLNRVQTLSRECATELRASASHYRRTDDTVDRTMDRTYKPQGAR